MSTELTFADYMNIDVDDLYDYNSDEKLVDPDGPVAVTNDTMKDTMSFNQVLNISTELLQPAVKNDEGKPEAVSSYLITSIGTDSNDLNDSGDKTKVDTIEKQNHTTPKSGDKDVKMTDGMWEVNAQLATTLTDQNWPECPAPKMTVLSFEEDEKARHEWELKQIKEDGCIECGRAHKVYQCPWVRQCVEAGLLVKQRYTKEKHSPPYDLIRVDKEIQISLDNFINIKKGIKYPTRKMAYDASIKDYPLGGSGNVHESLRPGIPVEVPSIIMLSPPTQRKEQYVPKSKVRGPGGNLMLPRTSSPYQKVRKIPNNTSPNITIEVFPVNHDETHYVLVDDKLNTYRISKGGLNVYQARTNGC